MQIEEYKKFADSCFRDTPPPCAAVCPLSYDVREFIKLMQRGSFRSAYKLYRNSVIFPSIVSELCPAYCRTSCVRSRVAGEDPVDLKALEKKCVEYMAGKMPERFAIPKKQQTIAVIGAGLSGLSCAYRLASFGYPVTVYEAQAIPGGSLKELLDPAWYTGEIAREFSAVDCSFKYGQRITGFSGLEADAFYVAAGGNSILPDTDRKGIFRKEYPPHGTPLESIAQGLRAATAIETFLKTGTREAIAGAAPLLPDERYYALHYDFKPKPSSTGKGEAEAFRCIRCNCTQCAQVCPLMEKYNYFPPKMCHEILATLKPYMSQRTAVRMIMGCTDCRKCREACPEHIDMGKCLSEAKKDFYESGAMAPVFHDFWLEDMAFSRSGEAGLVYRADPGQMSDVVFFPGCQLGASLPDYVKAAYDALCRASENAALYLGCCGVPARWAGRSGEASAVAAEIRAVWEELGKPKLISGCPSCLRNLRELLPELEAESVYSWLLSHPEALPSNTGNGEILHIADPCSAGEVEGISKDVRRLLALCGYKTDNSEPDIGCCGFGGHIYPSVPKLQQSFTGKRLAALNDGRIVAAYCANCRDLFAGQGADARHVLGLVLGIKEEHRLSPGLDERRTNRRKLKAFYTGEELKEMEPSFELKLSQELEDKMNRELLLKEQLLETISAAEENRDYILDEENGVRYAHKRFGCVTLWAAYSREQNAVNVTNVYSHRVDIREEL